MTPADRLSLRLHQRVAEKLDLHAIARAKERLAEWVSLRRIHPEYARDWYAILERPINEVRRSLLDPSDLGVTLRSTSPFTFVLTRRERYDIWKNAASSPPSAASNDSELV